MPYRKLSASALSALALAGCLLTGVSLPIQAQGLPGLTIFSGVERDNQLAYRLDYFGRLGARDRYRLRIPRRKMDAAVSELFVTYPATYTGEFDPDEVELKVNGDKVDLNEVVWDEENRTIEIYPTEPVPANTRVEIVLSRVQNPNRVGTHYFNALVISPGEVPIRRYVGTWILSIGDQFGD